MDLHTGAPYWLVRDGMGELHPVLTRDERCDVVVVGAGITGALVADELSARGAGVVVIDRREPGIGSTAASTALVLYETDHELAPLIDAVGERNAVRAWSLGREAIDRIEEIARSLPQSCHFSRTRSLYLSSRRRHVRRLQRETTLRQKWGFDAEFLDADEMRRTFCSPAHGAIRASASATIDPLRLTQQLLARAVSRGARVYARTTMATHELTGTGVLLHTASGHRVIARRVVFATGYEAPEIFPHELMQINSTFAIATARVAGVPPLVDGHAVWESARPYAYLRSTPEGRVIIGGGDVRFERAALRDRALPGRANSLERRLTAIFPDTVFERAFEWAGTFAQTSDALPFIGALPHYPRGLFALGYGGNGITFSVVAARIIADLALDVRNDDADVFRLDR
jgi:glycine/D-amino acid oxidase-like deaminating enzyme